MVLHEVGGTFALVEGLIVSIHFDTFRTKLTELLLGESSSPNIGHNVVERCMVFAWTNDWTRGDITKNGGALIFEGRFWSLFNWEALLRNVTLTLNFGDADEITLLCLIVDPPQPLASDDDVNAM